MRADLAVLALLLLPAPSAFAHGGLWRPPGGSVTTPGSAGAPTTGGKAGVTAGGMRKGSPVLDRWEAWWFFQRESYLPRHTAAGREVVTGRAASPSLRNPEPAPAQTTRLLP